MPCTVCKAFRLVDNHELYIDKWNHFKRVKTPGSDMGYDFHVQSGVTCLSGALFAVVADAPASHLLAG